MTERLSLQAETHQERDYFLLSDDAGKIAQHAARVSERHDLEKPLQNFIEGIQNLDPEAKNTVRAIMLMKGEIEGSTQLALYGMGVLPNQEDFAHKEAYDRFSAKRKELFRSFGSFPNLIFMNWDMTEGVYRKEFEKSKEKQEPADQAKREVKNIISVLNPSSALQQRS